MCVCVCVCVCVPAYSAIISLMYSALDASFCIIALIMSCPSLRTHELSPVSNTFNK
jgi:hypothetical protein